MKTVQSFFLEQFEQPFRQNIISCCEKISNQNYDVIILLARKAACLFSVLEDMGVVSLNGIIVSDRVLMYNIEWLSGKRIAIIDDTIISGTTICKMIRQLKSIGANQIAVHALCVDDYWFVDNLLSESDKNYLQQSYMRVSHSMSIRFCKQIVNALSVVPRPYNIDFSINKSYSFTSRDFSLITECKEWKSVDTSTQLQHDNNIDCISLNFNRSFLNDFYSTLGGDYSKVLFAKIRVFTKFLDPKNKKGEIETKVVPYVIFNPIKVQFADDIIKAITDSENINTSVLSSFLTTNSSKLLFIQYYFAERLFIYWKSFIETILDKSLTFKKEKKDLYLLFPQQIITLFQSFKFESQILLCPNESSEQFLYDNTERGKENIKINPYDVLGELSTKFLNLYYTKERIARRNVKRLKKKIFTDAEYVAVEKRLDNGPSLLDLVRTVAPFMHDTSDIMLMVSSFLDNAIDNGIAVPITVDNGTYLYRGFRHGEEVIWGDMADKLVASFFERIFGKEGKVTMLRFEKLLVLFLKFGIRREILKPFNYIPPLEKTKLLCVRSYLFGEIAVEHEFDPTIHKSQSSIENEFNPILTNECDTCWISTRYKAQNVLVKEDIGKKTYLRLNFDNLYYKKFDKEIIKDEPSDLDDNIADKINEIADVFKDCINNKLLNDDNLVTLTSCLHLKDNAASIGAELHIFYSEIGNYMCSVNSRLREYNMDVSFLKSLRDFKINKVWTAVNSGANKYISYKKHVASSIIKSVSDKLNSIDERTSRDWRKIWNTELELANSADLRLSDLNDRMGLILYDILITLQYLHLLIYESLNRNGANRQYLADCKEKKKKYDIDIKRNKDDKDVKQKCLDEKNRITKDLRNWEQYVDIDLEKTKSWINDLNEISLKA